MIADLLERVDRAMLALVSRRGRRDGEGARGRWTSSPTRCSRTSSYEERELVEPLARLGFY